MLAFYGFLRIDIIGEITSSLTVPNKNLLHFNQISIVNDTILIKFVSYKHSLGKPFFLTIHGAKDLDYCPVQCLKNYINQRGVQDGPLFCYVPCTPVTRIKYSVILKNCLSFANIQMGKITSHSFRIGMASHCTDCGISDGKIRLLGRWKSDAFKSYIKPVNSCNKMQLPSLVNTVFTLFTLYPEHMFISVDIIVWLRKGICLSIQLYFCTLLFCCIEYMFISLSV